jgi:hypothetical protein
LVGSARSSVQTRPGLQRTYAIKDLDAEAQKEPKKKNQMKEATKASNASMCRASCVMDTGAEIKAPSSKPKPRPIHKKSAKKVPVSDGEKDLDQFGKSKFALS